MYCKIMCLDIDHIVSIAEVLYSERFKGLSEEQRMICAFHWSNLMPLIAQVNIEKGDKPNPLREWIEDESRWRWTKEAKAKDPSLVDFDLPSVESCSDKAASQAKLLKEDIYEED